MATIKDISEYKKLNLDEFYEKTNDSWYQLIMFRSDVYESLEAANIHDEVYTIHNQLSWKETDGALDGIQTLLECIGADIKIHIYARITD